MAQTERDQVVVRALLADNATKNISPQDLRDALASKMGYGGFVVSVGAGDPVMSAVPVTPTLIDVFNVVTAQSSDVNTDGVVAQLAASPDPYSIIIGATGIYKVDFWASFASSGSNKVVTFTPHLNGVPGLVEVARKAAANDLGSVAFGGIIPYTAGDMIQMYIHVDAGTSDMTFHAAGFQVFRVG